jgi:hypothetical protein
MDPTTLGLRRSSVIQYLRWLETASHTSWLEVAQQQTLARLFVLCHPAWLEGSATQPAGLGLHEFQGSATGGECQANLLWGYDCPLTEEEIQSDHLFPLALGGPAVGTNQVWLCRVHNQWKSSNLLEYPWERGEPQWLARQVELFAERIDRHQPLHR